MPEKPPSLQLGDDVDAGSRVLDFAKIPLGTSIFTIAAIALRNVALEKRINREFSALQTLIDESLSNPQLGYLLDVKIYTDEFGNVTVPSGQMVYAVGVGVEPIDALAEFFRKPQLREDLNVDGLVNSSVYIWITKAKSLMARTVAPEFRARLVNLSLEEAERRDRLADWRRALPQDPYASIARAEFWAEMERTKSAMFSKDEQRRQVANLTREMELLQERANKLYQEYQDVLVILARQQQFTNVLNKISTVASVCRSAMDVRSLVSSKNAQPVLGVGIAPQENASRSIELTEHEIFVSEGTRIEVERKLKVGVSNLQDTELKLESIFRDSRIPLPRHVPIGPFP